MSRVGLKPISLPKGVEVHVEGNTARVKGPKGELSQHIPSIISVSVEGGVVRCTRPDDAPKTRAAHGLVRALIHNQVKGVSEGFSRKLSIVGVGYKAEAKGKVLALTLGYSHPIEFKVPDGIQITTPDPTSIVIAGIDKQKVGQVAAEIRNYREPEPYKGKGVRYDDEVIHRKAGKSAAKA
jgi:large subunit ribosomal protein L6